MAGEWLCAEVYFNSGVTVNEQFTFTLSNLLLNEGSPVARVKSGVLKIKGPTAIEVVQAPVVAKVSFVNSDLHVTGNSLRVIHLFDLSGKAILHCELPLVHDGEQVIPVAALPAGMYIVSVENRQGLVFRNKLMKQ
jgi:hypothetical protein